MTVRDTLVLRFATNLNRFRSVRIPDPQAGLDASAAMSGAGRIVAAQVFDPAAGSSGVPVGLDGAHIERVATSVLFAK